MHSWYVPSTDSVYQQNAPSSVLENMEVMRPEYGKNMELRSILLGLVLNFMVCFYRVKYLSRVSTVLNIYCVGLLVNTYYGFLTC